MKLFGEYLVEKGVVGADALAAALVEQVRRTPSVCQVVHEQRLLSTDDFLAVMARQSRDRGGFVEACRAMGHWNEAFQTRVEHAIAAVRIPLGQLLVQRGAARFEDLSRALDEFLADVEGPKRPAAAAKPAPAAPAPATAHVDDSVLADLREILADGRRDEVLALITAWEADAAQAGPLIDALHSVGGVAGFVRADAMRALADRCESRVRASTGSPDAERAVQCALLREAVDLFWKLRQELLEKREEAGWLAVASNRAFYDALMQALGTAGEGGAP
jgi:hypothetical protein